MAALLVAFLNRNFFSFCFRSSSIEHTFKFCAWMDVTIMGKRERERKREEEKGERGMREKGRKEGEGGMREKGRKEGEGERGKEGRRGREE